MLCLAGRLAALAARLSRATTGTSIEKSSARPTGECLQPSPTPPPTPPAPFTCEVNARGDRVHVLAGVGLRRAGGRPRELCEQSGQAGLDGRGRIGRESRPHICSLVCTRAYGTCTHVETSVARRAHVSGSRRIWTSGLCMCPVRTVFVIRCERHACRTFVLSTVASCPQGFLQEFAGPFRG